MYFPGRSSSQIHISLFLLFKVSIIKPMSIREAITTRLFQSRVTICTAEENTKSPSECKTQKMSAFSLTARYKIMFLRLGKKGSITQPMKQKNVSLNYSTK